MRLQGVTAERGKTMSQTLAVEYATCEDCEQEFPQGELVEKYSRYSSDQEIVLWCEQCQEHYVGL
jgi:hypothetical protein